MTSSLIDTLKMYGRFTFGLRDFYKNQTSLEQAKIRIRQCIRERDDNFLRVIRTAVFGWPKSPYRWLFKLASCEYADVEKLVSDGGVEHALKQLRAAGIYVGFEEFKGRAPIRRGGDELEVSPADFFNPYLANVYYSRTGGNTGAGTRIPHDLDHMRFQAAQQAITQDAHGVLGLPTAIWCGVLPDGSGVNYILRSGHIGHIPAKWFSESSVWSFTPSSLKFRIASLLPVIGGRMTGLRMPFPETLELGDAERIARWAQSMIREHGGCLVNSSVSRAVRVCIAAAQAGIDLEGTTFRMSGEPVSQAKVDRITQTGARFYTSFAQSEAGRIGEGCCAPSDPTDVHLLTGFCAMISHPRELSEPAARVETLHLTTILPQAPIIMLNTELDDCGTIEQRACGCPLHELGMDIHLRNIYSYDKLTAEGVTVLGSDMVRILEEVLPTRIGGTSQDYQFLEAENAEGLTRLSLLVSPRVHIENEQMVRDIILDYIRKTGPGGVSAEGILQQAETLRIERREPIWTDRGKLLTLYKARSR
jgi:hypothetical protein